MGSLADDYCNQIKDQFKIEFPAFPPNKPIVLGDYGVLAGNVYTRLGNITDDFDIKFSSQEFPGQPASFNFESTGSTEVDIHAKGDATPTGVAANAGIDLSFSSNHSVFFNAAGCFPAQIQDLIKLGNDIMDLFRQKKWRKEFVVVTNLFKGGSTTAIISASSDSSINLDASGNVTTIDLSDASLKLTIKHSKALALTIVTQGSLTPLFGLSQVQGLFNPDFGPIALRSLKQASASKPEVVATDDGDFLMFREI